MKSGAKSKASFHVVGFRLGPQSFNKKLHKPFEWAGSRLAKPASSNFFPSFVLFDRKGEIMKRPRDEKKR